MLFQLKNLWRNALSAATVAVLCAAVMPAANASPIYDNLGSSRDGSDPIFGFGPLANSFTTDAAGFLGGVTALLKNGSTSIVGDIQISLHANGANVPGAELASLGTISSADVATADFAEYSFAPLTSYLLAANTTYWIEIIALDPNALEWSWSNDLSATGVAGQSNYSAALGTNANSSFGPYQMAVSQVPEPESLALVFLGLGLLVVVKRRS
jgi:hypothetical protein